MKLIIRYAIGVVLFFLSTTVSLNAQPVEMADTMRSEGKIYVVVGIVLIVLTGLIVYLFMLDRRVKKLENGQK
ncbi:MAG: CcmD family protein [Cyclobacteriaceae bacterium]|nr:CcmD family protein [Cyclobacteriaceae bacterium]